MRCPHCQRDLPNDATSCPSCATSLDAATQRLETPKSPRSSQRTPSYDSIDDARFIPGTMLAERYRIVGLLGKGGMGEVYRADDLKLGQPVALKFLPDRLLNDGASLARFHREVRVARQVSHKNVCRVYDIGEVNGQHFLSMEYIKGEELSSLLRRIGRLPADKAVQIARQICAGLAAAHESGVLHRDLKPSNVMIDGDGNARILDFGLAGLAEDIRGEDISTGTPAYMAPEQLDGSAVTPRSDIYSLGLVLYELFTGRKAFEAASLNELIRLRRSDTTPTTPTSIVKDLDPVIERVIERCMDKDPSQRPSSALQVAAALPGGDPLAAALAAGETPSPEMVAAAPKKGTLRPVVALGLLGLVLVFIATAIVVSKYAGMHRLIPLEKPPDVLKEQANQIAKSFGYTNTPADVANGFLFDRDYYSYLRDRNNSLNPWEVLRSAQPSMVRFWYRQSPTALVPNGTQWVGMKDPPNEIPGMVRMSLDTEARLVYFDAVPEQVARPGSQVQSSTSNAQSQNRVSSFDSRVPSQPTSTKDSELETRNAKHETAPWSSLFAAAGFDGANFQPTESLWTPPRAYDERRAWSRAYPNLPQVPIRLEAAAYRGRPVYFEIVSPWSKPTSEVSLSSAGEKVFIWIVLGMFFSSMVIAALLSLRNLRLNRGDLRGAFRVALFLFVMRMTAWLFGTHHVATAEELMLLVTGLQSALFWACFVGLLYLALEPYLRRRWPQRIISWNRLLAGDFRDPLVGRDILIGAVAGSFAVAVMYSRLAIPRLLGLNPGMPEVPNLDTSMGGFGAFANLFIDQVSSSLILSFMIVFMLLFLSLLLRKDWLGVGLGFVILTTLLVAPIVGYESVIGLISTALVSGAYVFCAVRFGPLALMCMACFFHLYIFYPITTEFTSWYAISFVLGLIVLLALAVYGYYVSLGGRSPFNVKLLAED